jgi:hypothetical protein
MHEHGTVRVISNRGVVGQWFAEETMHGIRELALAIAMVGMPAGAGETQSAAPSPEAPQQQTQPPAEKNSQPAKKPLIETPTMRLAAARNVALVRTRGSAIPAEVVRTTMEGWGRFTFVESPEKADLIIEIASSGDSGVQVSSSSTVSPQTGREEKSSSSRRDISPTDVRMTVIDARNKRVLWTATESVKFAMKEKARENNLVEAAERLASKFHERLEPK